MYYWQSMENGFWKRVGSLIKTFSTITTLPPPAAGTSLCVGLLVKVLLCQKNWRPQKGCLRDVVGKPFAYPKTICISKRFWKTICVSENHLHIKAFLVNHLHIQGSKFKQFYLKKVLNSWTKSLKSRTKQLHYDANITFGILVKRIQGYGAGASELILKFRSRIRNSVENLRPEPEL